MFFAGLLFSCNDLDVEDQNNLKLKDVYSDPDLFNELVEGAGLTYWKATEWSNPSFGLGVASQTITASWTNYGGADLGSIPRKRFENSTSYKFRYIAESPWRYLNAGIVQCNDILQIMENEYNGEVVNSDGVDITNLIKTNAFFIRGLCLGHLGVIFDKAYIIRSFDDEAIFKPYQEVIAAAIEDLEAAIQIASSDNTVTNSAFNGVVLDAAGIVKLASSYIAKLEAVQARDESEVNSLVDWNKVKVNAERGITSNFEVIGDGAPWDDGTNWWSRVLERGQRVNSCRVSQRLVKMLNPNKPEVPYPFPDGVLSLPEIEDPEDARMTTDFKYYEDIPFKTSRGYYFFSNYNYERYIEYRTDYVTPIPVFTVTENNLLLAEALVRTGGDKQLAAEKINNTRVNRGGLPALSSSDSDEVLLSAITYERLIECSWQGFANGFCYRRIATDDNLKLEQGQFLHLPVPAKELEIVGEEIYSFGGDLPIK